MKIKWLGHAAFMITAGNGTIVITDPYAQAETLLYDVIDEAADIVTMSHEHGDHNNIAAVNGKPQGFKGEVDATIKGITIKGINSFHDNDGGTKRGPNTIFCLDMDDMRVCHVGDLGHLPDKEQLAKMGKVDILLVPVGGFFTIDAATATQLMATLKPKVTIPMHFNNEKCNYPVAGVADFLKGKNNVNQVGNSEIEITRDTLPDGQVIVLKPAK